MSAFDPETGIWLVADNDSPEHQFDFSLAVAMVKVLNFYDAMSVVDLGCGMGQYCDLLRLAGIPSKGYDGNPNTYRLTEGKYGIMDLSKKIYLHTFDWVISLEVGEHIPQQYEQIFIDNLTQSATEGIILSWAIPDQGGFGHVNCQPNEYIIDQLKTRGLRYHSFWSAYLRKQADLSWFRNTLMVFVRISK